MRKRTRQIVFATCTVLLATISGILVVTKGIPAPGRALETSVSYDGIRYSLMFPRQSYMDGERIHTTVVEQNTTDELKQAWSIEDVRDSFMVNALIVLRQVGGRESRCWVDFVIRPISPIPPQGRVSRELDLLGESGGIFQFPVSRIPVSTPSGYNVWLDLEPVAGQKGITSAPVRITVTLPSVRWSDAYALYKTCIDPRRPTAVVKSALTKLADNYPDAPFITTACLTAANLALAAGVQQDMIEPVRKVLESRKLTTLDRNEVRECLAKLVYTVGQYQGALRLLEGLTSYSGQHLRQQIEKDQASGVNTWQKMHTAELRARAQANWEHSARAGKRFQALIKKRNADPNPAVHSATSKSQINIPSTQ